ncbi:MAG: ATP-binding protein [Saprospiraceae bacterium]|nr:ATP-binding protein [Lewinella sp.]
MESHKAQGFPLLTGVLCVLWKTENTAMNKDQRLLIIISGLPGTGKTSLALALAPQLAAVHLNTDMLREELQKKGQYDPETKAMIYEELRTRAEAALIAGKSVVIDGTFYQQEYRGPFLAMADKYAVPLRWIELDADPSVIKKRVSHQRPYTEADFSVYQKIKKDYEPLTIQNLTLSSGEKSIDELMEKVLVYIASKD